MLNENRLRRIEEMARQALPQPRHPATLILSVKGKNIVVWSDGVSENVNHAQVEDLRADGKVGMVIGVVSDECADQTRRVLQGEVFQGERT